MSKSAILKFYLDGVLIPAPVEWPDIEISASFEEDATQANITIDRFTFVNEARQTIKNWIAGGLSGGVGIFQGPNFRIEAIADAGTVSVFDGYLDLTESMDFPEQGRFDSGIRKKDGTGSIEDRLAATTYGYLLEQGFITPADYVDIRYVVMKPVEATELATTAIMLFLLSKTLAEQVEKTAKDIATASGILVAGVTGTIGAAIYAVAVVAIDIVYSLALLSALLKIGGEILNAFIPIARTHKAITLRKLLEAAASYAGYGFDTDIDDLQHLVYLPSNIAVDKPNAAGFLGIPGTNKSGIPNSSDYGYTVAEVFALCKSMFNARFAVLNGVLQLRSKNSPFWLRSASYTLPDVLAGSERLNTNEMAANRLIAFDTDIADVWTIENFKGTNYEIITTPVMATDAKAVTIKGLDETRLLVCLGNRKGELTALEKVLKAFAVGIDALANVFGGNSTLANRIAASVNVLKVGDNNHSKPKLLWMQSGEIPANHRDLFSAKTLWEKYHIEKSFTTNNGTGQKYVYESVRIPFGLVDFVALTENSYIATTKGQAKVMDIQWRIGSDYATVSYWVRQRYTANLKETYIEPE